MGLGCIEVNWPNLPPSIPIPWPFNWLKMHVCIREQIQRKIQIVLKLENFLFDGELKADYGRIGFDWKSRDIWRISLKLSCKKFVSQVSGW
jgi:hypothetical protein